MNEAWLERWQIGRTGWHEPEGNASLKRYWAHSGRRVLVPLCGKTPDLLWLESKGNAVTGIELSELAVTAFFEENALEYTRTSNRFDAVGRRLTLFCGDYFEHDAPGSYDALYDRGSLVALPAELRLGYAEHTSRLLTADAELFVITVEYDQAQVEGPPFSLSADEIHSYWPDLELRDRYDDLANCPPKFVDGGLTAFHEVVWQNGLTTERR